MRAVRPRCLAVVLALSCSLLADAPAGAEVFPLFAVRAPGSAPRASVSVAAEETGGAASGEPLLPLAEAPAAAPAGEVETGPVRPTSRLLLEDLRWVATSPARLGWRGWTATVLVGGALAGWMGSEHGDVDTEGLEGSPIGRRVADVFEPMGAEGSLAVLGGFWLYGAARHDDHARHVALDGALASVVASGLVTPLLKASFGRSRPRQAADSTDFHPFGGHASFPSGHTTQAFAVASVIAAESRSRWVDVAAYGSAAAVGYARVLHDRHYVSDVAAGALIGTLVGRAVARHNQALRARRVAVEPWVGPRGGLGLAVTLHPGARPAAVASGR